MSAHAAAVRHASGAARVAGRNALHPNPQPGNRVRQLRSQYVRPLVERVGADEETRFPVVAGEGAHAFDVNNDRVEAAYRRTDLFDRRRELMQQWDD